MEVSEISFPVRHSERPMNLFGSRVMNSNLLYREAISSKLQPIDVTHHSSTASY